jgi:hypothetical protein
MREYVGAAVLFSAAAVMLGRAYFALRHPREYLKTTWWTVRGLRRDDIETASVEGAVGILVGAILIGMGCLILDDVFSK